MSGYRCYVASAAAFCLSLLILVPGAAAQDVALRGFVTDASSGQVLVGANVVLFGGVESDSLRLLRGIASDENGYYVLTGIAPGRYLLRVSYVGYAPLLDTLRLGRQPFVTRSVALAPTEAPLEEVLVEAETGGVAEVEAGLQRIRPVDLERIPTPGPGGDLAMYLQSLPGVVTLGDRGGHLFIRGGKPSHNLILIDGGPIYQPFHIVGFFSAFPQELISSVDFYAGGFPARYNSRISSVIDVQTRGGNNRSYEGGLSVGPFLTGVRVEGPIVGGGSSFLALLRTSVIEHTAPTLIGEELPLKFSDQFVKLQSVGASGRCSATGMHTYDRGKIDLESSDVFQWTNYVLAGHCLTFAPNAALTAEIDAGFSYFQNTVGSSDPSEVRDERTSNIWQLYTKIDMAYAMDRTELDGGFKIRVHHLDYRLQELFQGVGETGEDFLISAGAHGGAKVPLGNALINPSVTFSVPFGVGTFAVEPRLRFSWQPWGSEAQELNAAVGYYRQLLDAISDERDAGSVFSTWLVSPLQGGRPTALHAILGWKQELADGLNISVEGYYKDLSELPVPIWDTNARFTITLDEATGTVYGFDARVSYDRQPFYFYVGYGYAQTEYCLAGENFGAYFGEPVQCYHPPHDRRHQVNAVASADVGEWQASVRWQFGSGRPYTPPIGFDAWFDLRTLPNVRAEVGNPRFLFVRPYGSRLSTYHRLDVSVERRFELPFADLTVEAGAINLYDRDNLFYFDLFTLRRVDQLPLIPYLTLQIETP